jgi:hypothetical protein
VKKRALAFCSPDRLRGDDTTVNNNTCHGDDNNRERTKKQLKKTHDNNNGDTVDNLVRCQEIDMNNNRDQLEYNAVNTILAMAEVAAEAEPLAVNSKNDNNSKITPPVTNATVEQKNDAQPPQTLDQYIKNCQQLTRNEHVKLYNIKYPQDFPSTPCKVFNNRRAISQQDFGLIQMINENAKIYGFGVKAGSSYFMNGTKVKQIDCMYCDNTDDKHNNQNENDTTAANLKSRRAKACPWGITVDYVQLCHETNTSSSSSSSSTCSMNGGLAWIPRGLKSKAVDYARKNNITNPWLIHNHPLIIASETTTKRTDETITIDSNFSDLPPEFHEKQKDVNSYIQECQQVTRQEHMKKYDIKYTKDFPSAPCKVFNNRKTFSKEDYGLIQKINDGAMKYGFVVKAGSSYTINGTKVKQIDCMYCDPNNPATKKVLNQPCPWGITVDIVKIKNENGDSIESNNGNQSLAWIPRGLKSKAVKYAKQNNITNPWLIHNHPILETEKNDVDVESVKANVDNVKVDNDKIQPGDGNVQLLEMPSLGMHSVCANSVDV